MELIGQLFDNLVFLVSLDSEVELKTVYPFVQVLLVDVSVVQQLFRVELIDFEILDKVVLLEGLGVNVLEYLFDAQLHSEQLLDHTDIKHKVT